MRKIGIPLIILMATLASSSYSEAQQTTLASNEYLRKVKLHLTGLDVTTAEWRELRYAEVSKQVEKFLEIKMMKYLETKEHAEKTDERLSQLFRLRGWNGTEDLQLINEKQDYIRGNS